MRLFGLLLLANLACVTTRAPLAASQPEAISANDFLRQQWNAPTGSDDQFRGTTAIIGLVARRQEVPGEGSALDFQTIERSYFVRCWLTRDAAAAASSFERGQLVAVRGVGSGLNKDAPNLKNCSVTWLGDAPDSPPVDFARRAAVTAASVSLCAAEAFMRALADRRIDPLAPFVVTERERAARTKERSRATLEKARAPALPCDHPLVALVARCRSSLGNLGLGRGATVEGKRLYLSEEVERKDTSECAATQVKDALEQMVSADD